MENNQCTEQYSATLQDSSVSSAHKLQAAFVYLLFFVLLVTSISCKAYYHTDELQSYMIANRTMVADSGHLYDPYYPPSFPDCRPMINVPLAPYANLHFMISAPRDDRFNYGRVWQNGALDCHPPLYTALLHTICSFFPGRFSRWFAGAINIFFALAALFIARKIVRLFTDDSFILLAVSLVFACSSTILNSTAFFRMYIMAIFWITLQTYILLQYANKEPDRRFYVSIFFVTLFGTLTHHYCSMYFLLSSALFALCLLKDRRFKAFGKCCAVALSVFAADIAIFPSLLKPFLHGPLAGKLASNMSSGVDFFFRFKQALSFINNELFGMMLPLFAAALLFSVCCRKQQNDAGAAAKPLTREYGLIFIPSALFALVITKSYVVLAHQNNFRHYITPVIALLLVAVLLRTFTKLTESVKPKFSRLGIILMSVLLVAGSWFNTNWQHDYLYRKYLDDPTAKAFADAACVVVGSANFPQICETMRYASQTCFNSAEDFARSQFYPQFMSQDKLVLYFAPHLCPNPDMALLYVLGNNAPFYRVTKVPLYAQDPFVQYTDCMYYLERAGNQNMLQQRTE